MVRQSKERMPIKVRWKVVDTGDERQLLFPVSYNYNFRFVVAVGTGR